MAVRAVAIDPRDLAGPSRLSSALASTLDLAHHRDGLGHRRLRRARSSLIRRVPVMGERRDFFVAETDLWEMVTRIAAGRKEREIDPVEGSGRIEGGGGHGHRS